MGAADNNFPFSRKVWNDEIIKPINALCENPPDGCDEIDPLDEAEKDHIWKKQDVQDVHDKLKELCEDNEFDDLDTPQLDYKTLIEEILEAIQQGWCNCEPEEINLGAYTTQYLSHTSNEARCCGNILEFSGGFGLCRIPTVITYHSPFNEEWQADASQEERLDTRAEKYGEARREISAWAGDREQELLAERFAKQLRTDLESAEEALDNAQNALNSCTVNCSDEQEAVDHWQGQVDYIQGELDEAESSRDEYKEQAEEHLGKADAAAAANWEITSAEQYLPRIASVAGVLSYGINFTPNTLDYISLMGIGTKEWGLGPYPFDFQQAKTVLLVESVEGGVPRDKRGVVSVRYTPSGLPYGSWNKYKIMDIPHEEWSVANDPSGYLEFCPDLDPDAVGDFSRQVSGWGTLDVGDTFTFSKREESGTNKIEYEDL
jgi:hypothetical protein